MNGPVIGMDFGGTWIRAAVISSDGVCDPVVRRPTRRERPAAAILDDLAGVVEEALGAGAGGVTVAGLAAGVATAVSDAGEFLFPGNFPTLADVPVKRELEERLNLPVFFRNDADCFAAGEWWRGAGRGTRNFCGITAGTGLGLGLILDGRLHRGSHGCAGEIWKTPLNGECMEDQACGAFIEAEFARHSGRECAGAEIHRLALANDPAALAAYAAFGRNLGQIAAFLINTLDPDRIAVGGAVAQAFPLFSGPLEETVRDWALGLAPVPVVPAELGDQAALLGAARLFWDA